MSIQFPNDSASAEQVSHMTKCSHCPTFHLILLQFLIYLTVLIRLLDGNKTQTDFEITFRFNFRNFIESALKGKSDRKSYHVTTPLVLLPHQGLLFTCIASTLNCLHLSTMLKIILMQHTSFQKSSLKVHSFLMIRSQYKTSHHCLSHACFQTPKYSAVEIMQWEMGLDS